MQEKYLYICDKQPGACRGWNKGWKKCENEMCMHTSNIEHAKYKNVAGRKFAIIQSSIFFEVLGACGHPSIICEYQFEAGPEGEKLCTEKDCPAWQLRE